MSHHRCPDHDGVTSSWFCTGGRRCCCDVGGCWGCLGFEGAVAVRDLRPWPRLARG